MMYAPLGVAGLLSLIACASLQRPSDDSQAPVIVHVVNNGWYDSDIYVYHDGARFRIGDVPGFAQVNLRVPAADLDANGDLQLYIHRVADNDFLTPVIHISSEGSPVLDIEPQLDATSLAFYPMPADPTTPNVPKAP